MLITEANRVDGVGECVYLGSVSLIYESCVENGASDEDILSEMERLKSVGLAGVEVKVLEMGGNALVSVSYDYSGERADGVIKLAISGSVYRAR
ncbi:MAG: hypothetical protein ACKOW9_00620 [Candidatus Paceibacterota bacterium]